MNDSALYALLRSTEASERQQALQYLREHFPDEAFAICAQFDLPDADAGPVLEAAIASFGEQILYFAFAPDIANTFRYTLATECVLRRLANAELVSPLDLFDNQVRKSGWSQDPRWVGKVEAIYRVADPEVRALLQLLGLRHLNPEQAGYDCAEALGVELRSKDKIYSARRFYIGYFLKQWMLFQVDNHFAER